MEGRESPRDRRHRAAAAWLCCCCSTPSGALEPDSKTVRIIAGIVAIIAMLISGIGFSALQRSTVNPYEHLFTISSSSRYQITPPARGPAFAPAPGPMLQPWQSSSSFVSTESIAGISDLVPTPLSQPTDLALASMTGAPASSSSGTASIPTSDLAQYHRVAAAPSASTLMDAIAIVESVSPKDSGVNSPSLAQADLTPTSTSNGMPGVYNTSAACNNALCGSTVQDSNLHQGTCTELSEMQ